MAKQWKVSFKPEINPADFFTQLIQIESHGHFVHYIPVTPALRQTVDALNIMRAIKGTTGIEGNALSEKRVGEILANEFTKEDAKNNDELEALGAKKAHQFITSRPPVNGATISEDLIKTLHSLYTGNCAYRGNRPGEYRTGGVEAGDYRGPDYGQVPILMKQFIDFINKPEIIGLHDVIRAVLAHFYLVSIHPFREGNGRTSRGLEAYLLYNAGYNALGFYSLANFYYRERSQYIDELQDARFEHNGNLTSFVQFALDGFIDELAVIRGLVLDFFRRLAYRDYLTECAQRNDINSRIFSFIHALTRGFEVTEKGLKTRDDPTVEQLWKGLTSRALNADLKLMKDLMLIVVEDGMIKPNLALMDQFSSYSLTHGPDN